MAETYSRGMNEEVNKTLANCEWNFQRFTDRAAQHNDFDLKRCPPPEFQRLIVVHHRIQGHRGDFEVIDGAHRLVSMISNGMVTSEAYVAELGNPGSPT